MGSGLMTGGFDGWRGPSPAGGGGGGGKGVTSFNGQTGAVKGTLASIYAFGLGDAPATDNLFGMPSGNLYWQGLQGVNQYDVGFFGANGTGASATATHNFVRQWQQFNAIGFRSFNWYALNDPNWDGNVTDLTDLSWRAEDISFGNSATDTTLDQVILGRRLFEFLGLQPFAYGSGNTTLKGLEEEIQLWNQDEGLTEVRRTNSYGQQIGQVYPHGHGITPFQSGQLNFPNFVPSAGDGSGYFIAEGGSDFGLYKPKGAFTAIMNGAFGASTEWYSSIWAYPGSPPSPDEFTFNEVAQFWATVGEKIKIGGLQLPNENSATFAVSDATTVRAIWDDTLKAIMISKDGGAYVPFGSFFELDLSFGGGPSPGNNTFTGAGAAFWLQPTTSTATQFVPGDDSTEWEWVCNIATATAQLDLNVLAFVGAGGGTLTAVMTINGTPSGTVGIAFSSTGVKTTGAVAQAVTAGQTVGIKITGAGGSVTTNFTAHLRLT